MTDYNKWERKANQVVRQAEEDDEREKEKSNKALGLTEEPKGPTTVKAEEELKELNELSGQKQAIIDKMKAREVIVTRESLQEPVVLEDSEVGGKGVRIQDCKNCRFIIPQEVNVLKVFMERCDNVHVSLQGQIVTSTVEMWKCKEVDLETVTTIGVVQIDDCDKGAVRLKFAGIENIQDIYHHNAPGLEVSWGLTVDHEPGSVKIGLPYKAGQFITRHQEGHPELLVTEPVGRDETNFPLTLHCAENKSAQQPAVIEQPEHEPLTKHALAEQEKKQADTLREKANECFRNCDFMQAAALYSEALSLDEQNHIVWSNRAQCWLKMGNHEKALADASRSAELCPTYAKAWFRSGISYHAMGKFTQAIPALAEAEKLDPSNKQITDAIRMAQLMARQHGGNKQHQ